MKKYLNKAGEIGLSILGCILENLALIVVIGILVAGCFFFCVKKLNSIVEKQNAIVEKQNVFRYKLVVGFGSACEYYYVNNYDLTNGIITFTENGHRHEIRYVSLDVIDRKK